MEGGLLVVLVVLGLHCAQAAEPTWNEVSKDENVDWDMLVSTPSFYKFCPVL